MKNTKGYAEDKEEKERWDFNGITERQSRNGRN